MTPPAIAPCRAPQSTAEGVMALRAWAHACTARRPDKRSEDEHAGRVGVERSEHALNGTAKGAELSKPVWGHWRLSETYPLSLPGRCCGARATSPSTYRP